MLTHIVLFALHDPSDTDQTVALLMGMAGRIDGLLDVSAGVDTTDGPWHLGLVTNFTDATALTAYQTDPVHQEVVAWLAPRIADRAVVDMVVAASTRT